MDSARPFRLHLADGRVWLGAEFPTGFVCVHHPDEWNVCTIALTLAALTQELHPEDPLHGVRVEWAD